MLTNLEGSREAQVARARAPQHFEEYFVLLRLLRGLTAEPFGRFEHFQEYGVLLRLLAGRAAEPF